MKLIWLPLEILDERYTSMTRQLYSEGFERNRIPFIMIQGESLVNRIETNRGKGFLDPYGTIFYKSSQVMKLAQMFRNKQIESGDVIFIDDVQFPIELIRYIERMSDMEVKIFGVQHSGTYIRTDDINKMGEEYQLQEEYWLSTLDGIFVGSKFHKNEIIKRYPNLRKKIHVTGLPFDRNEVLKVSKPRKFEEREDIVLFLGRLHKEKQPELFEVLERDIKKRTKRDDIQFIKTMEHDLSKKEYYELLSKSKVSVSFALQENFGYAIRESAVLQCIPICPNSLSYPEFLPRELLYNSFAECVDKVLYYLEHPYNTGDIFGADESVDRMIEVIKSCC